MTKLSLEDFKSLVANADVRNKAYTQAKSDLYKEIYEFKQNNGFTPFDDFEQLFPREAAQFAEKEKEIEKEFRDVIEMFYTECTEEALKELNIYDDNNKKMLDFFNAHKGEKFSDNGMEYTYDDLIIAGTGCVVCFSSGKNHENLFFGYEILGLEQPLHF